jgi:AcrR family transcriptional regulator
MRRVAEKIEYSPTAIYVHFADKNELLPLRLTGWRHK